MARKRRRSRKSRQSSRSRRTVRNAVQPSQQAPAPTAITGIGANNIQRVPNQNVQALSIPLTAGISATGGSAGGGFGSLLPSVGRVLGGALGAAGSGTGPGFISGVTEENVQDAIRARRQGEVTSQGRRRRGATVDGAAIGGEITSEQRLKNFGLQLARQAGLSGEKAKDFGRKFAARGGRLGERSGQLAEGLVEQFPGAEIRDGRVVLPGRRPGFRSPGGEQLQDVFTDINVGVGESILGQDLPAGFAREAAEGLAFRDQLRGLLGQELGASGTSFQLSPQDEADLERELELGRSTLNRIQRGNLQNVTGQLQSAGFANSNLAARAIEEGVVRPRLSQELRLEAQLADRRRALQQQRLNERSQRVRNILGASGLSGPSSLSSLTAGFTSPGQAGQFTAPQSFAATNTLAEQSAGAARDFSRDIAGLNTTPTIQELPEQDGGGLFGGLF